jgi:RND superfamily putative drug exporter
MERFFELLGRFDVRFKYPIAIVWIVFTVFAVAAFPSLSSVAKDQNSGFLPNNTPSIQAEQLANVFQNTNLASMTLVAVRSSGPLTAADQATVDRLASQIKALPAVKVVQDLGLSRDGEARQVSIEANVSQNGTGTGKTLVDNMRSLFTKVGAPTGLALHLAGELPTEVDTQSQNNQSQGKTQSFSFIFILVLLLIAFRALLAPLVTLLPAALVLALSSPVIAASTRLGVQASSITQIILIVLILGAGTDYGLFLVFRVREELRRGLEPHAAVVRALTFVGETISFSAFTVIAAMLCLLAAQFGLYTGLGPALAIGIALMLLAGLTFLPALLAILGRAVFWPSGTRQTNRNQIGLWGRIGGPVLSRPLTTLVVGLIFFVGLALGQLGTGNTGFGDLSSGPAGTDSAAGQAAIAAHFPGSSVFPTAVLFRFPQPIWSHIGTVNTIQSYLKSSPWFVSAVGPTDPNGIPLPSATLVRLHNLLGPARSLGRVPPPNLNVSPGEYNAYRATAQYISPDGLTVQWATILKYNNGSSSSDIAKVPPMRDAIASFAPTVGATASGVFGLQPLAYDVSHLATDDLTRILPLVAVVILFLLALVLRSITAPFYLVASVLLSYLAALGFTSIAFVHLGPDSGINFVLPFLMFVFLTGLGSDYNILVMTRIREEARRLPLRQAVSHAVAISGGTITTAGVILAGTFAVLAVASGNGSGSDQIRQIGYGIAAGVLMDTFLIRTLLIPSLVILLGRWNWYPSALFHTSSNEPPAARRPDLVGSATK